MNKFIFINEIIHTSVQPYIDQSIDSGIKIRCKHCKNQVPSNDLFLYPKVFISIRRSIFLDYGNAHVYISNNKHNNLFNGLFRTWATISDTSLINGEVFCIDNIKEYVLCSACYNTEKLLPTNEY